MANNGPGYHDSTPSEVSSTPYSTLLPEGVFYCGIKQCSFVSHFQSRSGRNKYISAEISRNERKQFLGYGEDFFMEVRAEDYLLPSVCTQDMSFKQQQHSQVTGLGSLYSHHQIVHL
jgi:hypothetical protein